MAARTLGRLVLAVVFAAAAALPCAAASDLTRIADGSWVEARTANFVVLTNAGESRARYLVQNLEDFRRLVIQATNLEIEGQERPALIAETLGLMYPGTGTNSLSKE